MKACLESISNTVHWFQFPVALIIGIAYNRIRRTMGEMYPSLLTVSLRSSTSREPSLSIPCSLSFDLNSSVERVWTSLPSIIKLDFDVEPTRARDGWFTSCDLHNK